MPKVLIDVDTQFDFVNPRGSLHVPADPSVAAGIEEALSSDEYDAIIGSVDSHSYDAWEFKDNGGPFAPHCVKGTQGWLRVFPELPKRQRFIQMGVEYVLVGEKEQGGGGRRLRPSELATEAIAKGVGLYFEKEVYSLFDNPLAEPTLRAIIEGVQRPGEPTVIDIVGYCTGGYCVDAAAIGVLERFSDLDIRVNILGYAAAAIGGNPGHARSRMTLCAGGATWEGKR